MVKKIILEDNLVSPKYSWPETMLNYRINFDAQK
jgi:hypothetical protein